MVKEKINKYLFEDNIRRLFLVDMLRRKEYLKSITIEQLDCLMSDINTLISNLDSDFKKGKRKITVGDNANWDSSSLFRDIFLNNVLEIPIEWHGTKEDFKKMLEKRWEPNIKTKKEIVESLQ